MSERKTSAVTPPDGNPYFGKCRLIPDPENEGAMEWQCIGNAVGGLLVTYYPDEGQDAVDVVQRFRRELVS